ncbi:substrate-binding periplasmic protein [Primorskyibacter sp. S187A]|uniref:substrate-binding periplasmic protein n=1 Tax=Primorskyibacter sp. S187A TaxID=3415130 RepID=UPI003C7A700A
MKALRKACFWSWLCLMPLSGWAETLRVVADEWPPYSGAELPERGLAMDVVSSVLERAGYGVETRILPWARIMGETEAGEFEVVGTMFFNEERAQQWQFSEPYYLTSVQLIQRTGAGHSFEDIDSLLPLRVAVGAGTYYDQWLIEAEHPDRVGLKTTLQALQMVAAGRVDVAIVSVPVAEYYIRTSAPQLADQLEFAPGVLGLHGIRMAVRRSLERSDDIVLSFNETLAAMRADGSLTSVLDRHLNQQ